MARLAANQAKQLESRQKRIDSVLREEGEEGAYEQLSLYNCDSITVLMSWMTLDLISNLVFSEIRFAKFKGL